MKHARSPPRLGFLLLLLIVLIAPAAVAFKCPTVIDTTVPGTDWPRNGRQPDDPPLGTMVDVHNVLSRCPDITTLKLRVTLLGCSEGPDRWTFPFDQAGSSRYPSSPEVLSLEGYHFHESQWEEVRPPPFSRGDWLLDSISYYLNWIISGRAWMWAKWNIFPDEQWRKTNLDLWVDAMDFSRIRELTLSDWMKHDNERAKLLVSRLPPRLPALRSLAVSGSWATDLISSLPDNSLRHLSWISSNQTGDSLVDILQHHSTSLESLEWRTPETLARVREALSPDQIRSVAAAVPSLKHLTLDLNRNGTWPFAELEAIVTSFPRLTNLTVYLEMASECRRQAPPDYQPQRGYDHRTCEGPDEFAQPLLDAEAAEELFGFVAGKKVGEGLEEMHFRAGDWLRPWDGPLYFQDWLDGRKSWATCRRARDLGKGSSDSGRDARINVECAGEYGLDWSDSAPWELGHEEIDWEYLVENDGLVDPDDVGNKL
ncbi:uncharacterized protein DNG_09718 [Cephalotrichum gorgonifer]|uniref:Uncharacterized protein n=1 Tax=Cephalotrichum gorgonifer TaxID=2041049 RepID=A0AAE8N7R6_9PEZI|nr:uncharacterized protein DNG_09718 [Cephalotrichum gorgonifer]